MQGKLPSAAAVSQTLIDLSSEPENSLPLSGSIARAKTEFVCPTRVAMQGMLRVVAVSQTLIDLSLELPEAFWSPVLEYSLLLVGSTARAQTESVCPVRVAMQEKPLSVAAVSQTLIELSAEPE